MDDKVDLEAEAVYEVMVEILESRLARYNIESLKQYAESKVSVQKFSDRSPKHRNRWGSIDKTKIGLPTVRRWTNSYMEMYS